MKLSKAIQYINSAVNYPALNYIDIALFFDMAIAELNTTLHTSIPPVKDMVEEFRQNLSKVETNKFVSEVDPEENYEIPTVPSTTYPDQASALAGNVKCYYSTEDTMYYLLNDLTHEYSAHKIVKCLYREETTIKLFMSSNLGNSAFWVEVPIDPEFECDLDVYLPDDWVLLWLIPYVCFKYTVRDGGTSQTFAEELTQGFQQLQETYDVPDKVLLSNYADKQAYTSLVEANLPYLNIKVPTKAIYESMKHPRNTNAIYGSMYDRGGF